VRAALRLRSRAARPRPLRAQWQPTKEGYLSFLVESKAVYDCMEGVVATSNNPICAPLSTRSCAADALTRRPRADAKFRNTGLERGAALVKDIAWMTEQARRRRSALRRREQRR